MEILLRRTIAFTKRQMNLLRERARLLGDISVADVVRRIVDEYFEDKK